MTTAEKTKPSRTHVRRVRDLSIYVDGRHVLRGEEANLSADELMHFDLHGALAPEGATIADVEGELDAVRAAYEGERQSVADIGGI